MPRGFLDLRNRIVEPPQPRRNGSGFLSRRLGVPEPTPYPVSADVTAPDPWLSQYIPERRPALPYRRAKPPFPLPPKEGVPEQVMPTLTWLDKVKEIRSDPVKLVPFVSSGVEIFTIGKLLKSAADLDAGREVTREDLLALKEYVDRSQKDTSWGYKVADVVAQIVPFAGEFIATGGVFAVGKTAAVKGSTEALKRIATRTGAKILERKLTQYGIQVVGTVAGGTLRTIPAGVTRIPASTLEKQLHATLTGDEESIWESARKAFGEQWVEIVSESTGGLFKPLLAPIKGQLVRVGLFKAFLKANPTKGANDIRKVFDRLGYHGILEEMLEERVADVGHGILEPLGLSGQKFSLPSLQQLSVELVAFSIPGVAMKSLEALPIREILKGEAGGIKLPEEPVTPEVTPPTFKMGDKVFYKGEEWEVGFINQIHFKGTLRLQKSGEAGAKSINYINPDEITELAIPKPSVTPEVTKPLTHKEFIAQGKTEAEWDIYTVEQNRISRERGQQRVVELWQGEGVSGNDIANLLRNRGIKIPAEIAKGLQHDDTMVSATSVTGRGMSRREASTIHKWVSEQIRKEVTPPIVPPPAQPQGVVPVAPEVTITKEIWDATPQGERIVAAGVVELGGAVGYKSFENLAAEEKTKLSIGLLTQQVKTTQDAIKFLGSAFEELLSNTGREGYAYRGISRAELRDIDKSGFIKSKGFLNFEAEANYTLFANDPRTGFSYASGFAHKDWLPRHDRPGYVIEFKRPDDTFETSGYLGTKKPIPSSDIARIWEIKPREGLTGIVAARNHLFSEYKRYDSLQEAIQATGKVAKPTKGIVPPEAVKPPELAPVAPEVVAGVPPTGPPKPPVTGRDWESAFPQPNPPSGRPRTLSDLNREAKGMRAMTPEQRAGAMDVARPIPEGELLYKVKPFEEHAKNLLGPDTPIMARLRSLPGIKQTVGAWTPAQMARDNPVHMIGIRKAIFEEIETGRARIASLAWWNDAQDILGFKQVKGTWKATSAQPSAKADTKKANYRTIDDMLENPKHYSLTAEQKKILRIGQNMQRQLLRDAQRVGVNVVELGEAYWHRIVLKGPKDKMQGSWIRGRISGRKGYTHQRAFEKIDQGTELGFVYETHPLTRLQARLEAGIRTISDQEARQAISRLPGVEKPLERMESRYPQTLEGQKIARNARDEAKKAYLKDKTVENSTALRQAEADYIVSMREVFKKKIEAGNPSYYELRLPNGKIAPGELVEEVKKYIELPEIGGAETARSIVEITRLVRTTLTNVDLAAGFIQGQALFYRNNIAWWKAQSHAIVSLIDDPYAYVAKNQALMDEGMRIGAISIPTEFMFSKRGIASIPTRLPGIGPIMRACNRAFEWFIVVGQTELYRSTRTGVLKGVAKKVAKVAKVKPEPIVKAGEQIDQEGVDALVSLGSAIRKELGTESYALLGVGPRQRTVEQLTAFAARFFRANVGMIGQTFTKGPGGAEARKGMGALIAGGTSLLIGVSFLMYGKLPNLDDPDAPDWMQVRIGKTYFSPFGPYYSYFRALARIGKRTVEGKVLEAAKELKRFLQGRAGIPYRALDLAGQLLWANEATTFEGEVIERTPLGIAKGVLGELAVPISIQEAAQAIPEGRPESAVAEIFGLVGRGSPYAQMDMMFQGETDINPGGESYRYAEAWQEKEMAKRFPDIAEMMAGRGQGKYGHAQRQWNDIDKEFYVQEEALAKEFEEAEASGFEEGITHKEFGDRYEDIQKARLNKKAGVNKTLKLFQDERDLPDDPNDRALAEYYQLFDKARTASGRINWDESDELMAKLEVTWTPEQLEFVERNTGLTNHPPLIEEYRKARKTVSESGYWDIEEPNQFEKRKQLRQLKPEVDEILIKWYGYQPLQPSKYRRPAAREPLRTIGQPTQGRTNTGGYQPAQRERLRTIGQPVGR